MRTKVTIYLSLEGWGGGGWGIQIYFSTKKHNLVVRDSMRMLSYYYRPDAIVLMNRKSLTDRNKRGRKKKLKRLHTY